MVGRQRLNRCSTCRQRKLKCDAVKPACGQCQKAGWNCPGYVRTWDFRQISGSPKRPSDEACGQAAPWSCPSAFYEASARKICLGASSPVTSVSWSSSDRLCQAVCWSIDHNRVRVTLILLPPEPYIRILPQLVGISPVLDSAISCVVQTQHDEQLRINEYARAIRSLRLQLDRTETQPDFKTVISILLLQMFETSRSPWGRNACTHTQGFIRAVAAAGPSAFRDTTSQLMLTAGLGLLCAASFQQTSKCFLEQPEWQALLQQPLPDTDPTVALMRELAVHMARLPGLLGDFDSYCKSLSHEGNPIRAKEDDDVVRFLLQELEFYEADIQSWLAEQPSTDMTLHADRPSFSPYEQLLVAFKCLGFVSLIVTTFMQRHLTNQATDPTYLETLIEHGYDVESHIPTELKEHVADVKRALRWLECYAPHTGWVVQHGITMMTSNVCSCLRQGEK